MVKFFPFQSEGKKYLQEYKKFHKPTICISQCLEFGKQTKKNTSFSLQSVRKIDNILGRKKSINWK